MGSFIPEGPAIVSLSMHQAGIRGITGITDECTILPPTKLKLTCYNYHYLLSVLEIRCKITATDAALEKKGKQRGVRVRV